MLFRYEIEPRELDRVGEALVNLVGRGWHALPSALERAADARRAFGARLDTRRWLANVTTERRHDREERALRRSGRRSA
jgi:hypothetical protein